MTIYVPRNKLFQKSAFEYMRKIAPTVEFRQEPNNDDQPVYNKTVSITNDIPQEEIKSIGSEQMSGNGFMVRGAGIKHQRNEKIRKFINLNI